MVGLELGARVGSVKEVLGVELGARVETVAVIVEVELGQVWGQ